MRLFIGSVVFVGVLLGAFVIGITAQQTLLMMGSFCLWTPAIFMVGYALATSGIRIQIGREDYRPSSNSRVSTPQRRVAVAEKDF